MSNKKSNLLASPRLLRRHAPVFAALGDQTRISLLVKLSQGVPSSISALTEGLSISRQAATKHLRILEGAGLVRAETAGRECLFELEPGRLDEVTDYLTCVSQQWDLALTRLKKFVERPN